MDIFVSAWQIRAVADKQKFVGFKISMADYRALVLRAKDGGRTVSGLLRWLVRKLLET